MSTYLFYDIETTGLNKCFDQVVQFAAIRTDTTLQELERYEINIKRLPDVIPSPDAIITHRIGINQMNEGASELEAMRQIHAILNTPGTISLGYNTLGFDDEFLRFSFYRNLLPPYTHQFANNCARMDIYPMTVMYYLFKNNLLTWPTGMSLKLEDINHANQLSAGPAHQAMVDVEVTLALAKKLKSAPDMWSYLCDAFDKKTDLHRISKLPVTLTIQQQTFQEGIMVSGRFGRQSTFHMPVLSLGPHLHYKNQTLWLCLDSENLSKTTMDTIPENTLVTRKKPGEEQLVLPPHERFKQHLSIERQEQVQKNKQWLQEHPDIFQKIVEYHQHFKYPTVVGVDSQAALYDTGFPSPAEEKLYATFHTAPVHQKRSIVHQLRDLHRRTLAERLLARHFPEESPTAVQESYQSYCSQIRSNTPPLDFRGQPHMTVPAALARIQALREEKSLDSQQKQLLAEFELYLTQHAAI